MQPAVPAALPLPSTVRQKNADTLESSIRIALRFLLGATFLVSAYTKAIDFSSFELRILDTGLFGPFLSTWIAALLVIAEYAIGFGLLILHKKMRLVQQLSWMFLLVFTAYLLVLLLTKGNDLNCGCMGETISFTPVQAIVKNMLSMLMLFLLGYFEKKAAMPSPSATLHLVLLAMAVVAGLFTIPSLYAEKAAPLEKAVSFDQQVLLDSAFSWRNDWSDIGSADPKLFAFLSMSCRHCQVAADRLGSITQQRPLPVYLVINGDSLELDAFREKYGIAHLPATMLSAHPFIQLGGQELPSLMRVKADSITHRLRLFNLNGKVLEKLLHP